MDKISAMKVYVKVVEATSFTGAAEVLHASTTHVTRMVQALEQDLGVKLLNRTTRRSRPTDAGLRYYERCVALLRDLDEMDADVQASRGSQSGIVRVSMPALIAKSSVTPNCQSFSPVTQIFGWTSALPISTPIWLKKGWTAPCAWDL